MSGTVVAECHSQHSTSTNRLIKIKEPMGVTLGSRFYQKGLHSNHFSREDGLTGMSLGMLSLQFSHFLNIIIVTGIILCVVDDQAKK